MLTNLGVATGKLRAGGQSLSASGALEASNSETLESSSARQHCRSWTDDVPQINICRATPGREPAPSPTWAALVGYRDDLEIMGSVDSLVSNDSNYEVKERSVLAESVSHELTYEELVEEQQKGSLEKHRLKQALKQFDYEFRAAMGRKPLKDDRPDAINTMYHDYKKIKARLKLIDALATKKKRYSSNANARLGDRSQRHDAMSDRNAHTVHVMGKR